MDGVGVAQRVVSSLLVLLVSLLLVSLLLVTRCWRRGGTVVHRVERKVRTGPNGAEPANGYQHVPEQQQHLNSKVTLVPWWLKFQTIVERLEEQQMSHKIHVAPNKSFIREFEDCSKNTILHKPTDFRGRRGCELFTAIRRVATAMVCCIEWWYIS